MTCRTRFFPSDGNTPRQAGNLRAAEPHAASSATRQWLTVYLQPFDRRQIAHYMRKAIPWRRFAQRSKAKRIAADISGLAARPMLAALIPGLAASRREAQSLWDLYSFMADAWIQRESSRIAPDALRRISRAAAVELIDRQTTRGAQRISHEDLIKLCGIETSGIETWQPTSRSLLNRDADGHYRFAHRPILEFFFIEAFLGGEQRCLSLKWTDMMRDLFLGWGSSAHADDELALRLLSQDFRLTGLFPIAEPRQPPAKLDGNWVKSVFSARPFVGARAKFPNAWRSAVARFVHRGAMARAYGIADGLVWQWDITNPIHEREERYVYLDDRYSLAGTDGDGREWAVVDLYELKLLCDILAKKQALHSVLDDRELYWLADTGGDFFSALARVRPGQSGEALSYPGLEFVHSGSDSADPSYTIDVYRVATKGLAISKVRAMTILAHHGDAAGLHADDQRSTQASSWSMRREQRLPANLGRPSPRPAPHAPQGA